MNRSWAWPAAGLLISAAWLAARHRPAREPGLILGDIPRARFGRANPPFPPASVGDKDVRLGDEPASPPERASRRSPSVAAKAARADPLSALEEILASGNDGDPRLDSEFSALTGPQKRSMERRYGRARREEFQARGTIAFLLGRAAETREDWAFLRGVAAEPPCLSLDDCAKAGEAPPLDEVTLAYPQMLALAMAERALASRRPGSDGAWDVLREASRSRTPLVARKAAEIEASLARR